MPFKSRRVFRRRGTDLSKYGRSSFTDYGAMREQIESIYRSESRRVFATLIRLLGDIELAEEAVHDAFATALNVWPKDGVPANPRAWLVSTGRFQAIDRLRRRARFNDAMPELAERLEALATPVAAEDSELEDDRLRLIFTCCHPALTADARIALTLREVCGLETELIARAFLVPAPTLAQRIVRAKAKIREARIPYQVPTREELPDRLDAVLHVVYLVFNEGYSAAVGEQLIRSELCAEAIRICRLLFELLPESEVEGLLALMLLHDARRAARVGPDESLILLEDQDRSLWNRAQIEEGIGLVGHAFQSSAPGPYALQAAIAAVHAESSTAAATDWHEISGLYEVLLKVHPSPVVELNRAVAVAMAQGPAAGLDLIDAIVARGELTDYHLLHSARADLCRRLGRFREAADAYRQALALTNQIPERRFLERRLAELAGNPAEDPCRSTLPPNSLGSR